MKKVGSPAAEAKRSLKIHCPHPSLNLFVKGVLWFFLELRMCEKAGTFFHSFVVAYSLTPIRHVDPNLNILLRGCSSQPAVTC